MILLLDTSTPTCKLTLVQGDKRTDYEWLADRDLAKGLLKYIHTCLESHQSDWSDVKALGVFEGPGSFTGLRIGLTILNTIASSNNIPIIGGRGTDWQDTVLATLNDGQNDQIVLPFYGSEPHITQSRK